MTIPEIVFLALIAITFLYWATVIVPNGRARAAGRKQKRSDTLHDAADPARGRASDVEHDATG